MTDEYEKNKTIVVDIRKQNTSGFELAELVRTTSAMYICVFFGSVNQGLPGCKLLGSI